MSSKPPVKPLTLDVRPVIAKGGSPCDLVDGAVAKLKPGQDFILLVPFEPVPLYSRLSRAGYTHHSEQTADGTWRIEFKSTGEIKQEAAPTKSRNERPPSENREVLVDNRGLEAPEPMVRTLEAAGKLGKDERLVMLSDRKPLHLFKELETRGFLFDCTEQPDHSFATQIWHASGQ